MHVSFVTTLLSSLVVHGNDDGWAEANVRAFYQTLSAAGYNVVLSAPVQNQSGTGSSDAPAKPLTKPGQYDSVPSGASAQGANSTDRESKFLTGTSWKLTECILARLNYVNSYPVTAIKYGTATLAPKFFGGAPDIVVTGPNLGNNLGSTTKISGTVGAATEAVKEGIPAIAFSGQSGSGRSYTTLKPGDQSFVYAQVAQKLVAALTATAKPWLPTGVGLNVNFPAISSTCASVNDFKFVLTSIYKDSSRTDVETCGNDGHLPDESSVLSKSGKCYVTVSVFNANKLDASAEQQAAVLAKLSPLLTCS
ncbi:hypothetical protein FRC12_017718 [Ceratobasidium sp. 428]|nr:hypothetical protein FRC12_017718 [Ceratobasidium sp. 428]